MHISPLSPPFPRIWRSPLAPKRLLLISDESPNVAVARKVPLGRAGVGRSEPVRLKLTLALEGERRREEGRREGGESEWAVEIAPPEETGCVGGDEDN